MIITQRKGRKLVLATVLFRMSTFMDTCRAKIVL